MNKRAKNISRVIFIVIFLSMVIKPLYSVFSNILISKDSTEINDYNDAVGEESDEEDSNEEEKELKILSVPLNYTFLRVLQKSISKTNFKEGIVLGVLLPPPDIF